MAPSARPYVMVPHGGQQLRERRLVNGCVDGECGRSQAPTHIDVPAMESNELREMYPSTDVRSKFLSTPPQPSKRPLLPTPLACPPPAKWEMQWLDLHPKANDDFYLVRPLLV
ncbi:hypothetical protein M7I_4426 [Glarea lozoyensis 74030]|uniref:Uncharacterized protein n=1 Tax=Glarea lozoyensis (strain ATCC 74030 / MF5533) TaxID=1104152 RepID=H0EP56_GLAL7|nr:hypothetical protein M7I_4426 [Glarea lozoyensis 74030]